MFLLSITFINLDTLKTVELNIGKMLRAVIFITFVAVLTAEETTDDVLRTLKINVDKDCVEEKISLTSYENIAQCMSVQRLDDPFEDFVNRQCNVPICSNITLHELDLCLTDTQKDYLRNLVAIAFAARDYSCENDAKALREMNALNESACRPAFSAKYNCYANFSLIENMTIDDFFTEEPCRIRFNYKNCFTQGFDECEDKTLRNVHKKLTCAGVNATPCKNFIHECNLVDLDE